MAVWKGEYQLSWYVEVIQGDNWKPCSMFMEMRHIQLWSCSTTCIGDSCMYVTNHRVRVSMEIVALKGKILSYVWGLLNAQLDDRKSEPIQTHSIIEAKIRQINAPVGFLFGTLTGIMLMITPSNNNGCGKSSNGWPTEIGVYMPMNCVW